MSSEDLDRTSINLNAVIFTHDYGPLADLLDDFQVMCGGYHSLT